MINELLRGSNLTLDRFLFAYFDLEVLDPYYSTNVFHTSLGKSYLKLNNKIKLLPINWVRKKLLIS